MKKKISNNTLISIALITTIIGFTIAKFKDNNAVLFLIFLTIIVIFGLYLIFNKKKYKNIQINKKPLLGVVIISMITIVGLIIYIISSNKSKLVKCSSDYIKNAYGKNAECKMSDDEIKCNFNYNNFDTNMFFRYDIDTMKIYGKYFIVGNIREDDFNIIKECK